MSNRPHRRTRRRARVDPALVALFVQRAAHLAGCWCQPDHHVRHEHHGPVITVAHDDDCPAVAAPSLLALGPRRTPGREQ